MTAQVQPIDTAQRKAKEATERGQQLESEFPLDITQLSFAGQWGVLLALSDWQQRQHLGFANTTTYVQSNFAVLRMRPAQYVSAVWDKTSYYRTRLLGAWTDTLKELLTQDGDVPRKIPTALTRAEWGDVTRLFELTRSYLSQQQRKNTGDEAEKASDEAAVDELKAMEFA